MTFLVVLIGWIFSLSLHEFAHALVAYYGGDTSVRDKGYLTFNPLKYTHPLYSIALPLLFLDKFLPVASPATLEVSLALLQELCQT